MEAQDTAARSALGQGARDEPGEDLLELGSDGKTVRPQGMTTPARDQSTPFSPPARQLPSPPSAGEGGAGATTDMPAMFAQAMARMAVLEQELAAMKGAQPTNHGALPRDLNESIRELVAASADNSATIGALVSNSQVRATKKLALGDISKHRYAQGAHQDYVQISKSWLDCVATATGSDEDYTSFGQVPEPHRAVVRRAIKGVLSGAALNAVTIMPTAEQADLVAITDKLLANYLLAEDTRKERVKDQIEALEFRLVGKTPIETGLTNLQTIVTNLATNYAGVRDLTTAETKGANEITKLLRKRILVILPDKQLSPLENELMETSTVTEIVRALEKYQAYAQTRDQVNRARRTKSSTEHPADSALAVSNGSTQQRTGASKQRLFLNIDPKNVVRTPGRDVCAYKMCQQSGHFMRECAKAKHEHAENNRLGRRWNRRTGELVSGTKPAVPPSSHGGHGGTSPGEPALAVTEPCLVCGEPHSTRDCSFLGHVRELVQDELEQDGSQ